MYVNVLVPSPKHKVVGRILFDIGKSYSGELSRLAGTTTTHVSNFLETLVINNFAKKEYSDKNNISGIVYFELTEEGENLISRNYL